MIKRRKHQLFTLWEFNGSSFEQTWIPFIQGCIVPGLVNVEISQAVLEEKIFIISSLYFYLIRDYLPLEKGFGPSFEETWFPFTQGCIVPSLIEISPVVLEKKILKFRQCIFAIS